MNINKLKSSIHYLIEALLLVCIFFLFTSKSEIKIDAKGFVKNPALFVALTEEGNIVAATADGKVILKPEDIDIESKNRNKPEIGVNIHPISIVTIGNTQYDHEYYSLLDNIISPAQASSKKFKILIATDIGTRCVWFDTYTPCRYP